MYATQQDIIDAKSEEELAIVAPDGVGGINTDKVAAALKFAKLFINARVSTHYSLPIVQQEALELLKVYAVDIAFYKVAENATGDTDKKRKDFEDAEKFLNAVSKGTLKLGVYHAVEEGAEDSGTAFITYNERLFTRGKLRGVM